MSSAGLPVTLAVTRPDGSIEHVRVGTAVRVGDTFRLTLSDLTIGGAAEAAQPRRAAPTSRNDSGMVFPPYGRSKGAPVSGASLQDLEYYASGCRRTLDDPAKSRWHDKERQLLAAIEAEIAQQGGPIAGGPRGARGGRSSAPAYGDEPPMFRDEDAPPPNDDIPF